MSIPSAAANGLLARGSSLIVAAAGRSEKVLGGHRGLIKKTLEVAALTYQASWLGSWAYSRIYCE